jgi:RNA polymerase sigma-70 factor (ECF subfamily)
MFHVVGAEFSKLWFVRRAQLTIPSKKQISTMSEAEIIDRAKKGDDMCFKLLYDSHKRRVYSLCFRMVGQTETAEDLTQDAFLQLHRKIASFRGESAFSTWLHRLTVNIVLMHVRKKRLMEVSLDETLDPNDEGGPQKDFGVEDTSLMGSVDRVTLERAIECLPDGYRIIFVLHDVEGYEHNEIGEMLGCSVGNSKSQLHKARIKLRGELRVTNAEKARQKAPQRVRPEQIVIEAGTDEAASAA